MLIRREAAGDAAAIRSVTAAAFGKPGAAGLPAEATLVDELRADATWLPALSLVAVDGAGEVTGHVVCTRGHPGDLVEDHPSEARKELDQLAREITVRDSMIYLDGPNHEGPTPGVRTETRGRLMVTYLTDVRGERVVVLQVTWFG